MFKYAIFIASISLLSLMLYVGFKSGQYWTTQQMQKAAVAYSCGSIDQKTLNFSWSQPQSMGIIVDALPDVSSKSKQKNK